MAKEELEKEAEEKYFNHEMADFQGFYNRHYYCLGYLESSEPREKRIAELEKENAKLKEQIEKMKCCENCRHYSHTNETMWNYPPQTYDFDKCAECLGKSLDKIR